MAIAFDAQVHSIRVGMVFGDKEATLVMKFKPTEGVVDSLQGLVGGPPIMVGIVPVNIKTNMENHDAVQEGTNRKSGRKAKRGEA